MFFGASTCGGGVPYTTPWSYEAAAANEARSSAGSGDPAEDSTSARRLNGDNFMTTFFGAAGV
ncbi:hypothetical protein acdb102_26170 [Acidothermaceae bacterium B102]|nr:hypothetical protein acdb102_26170 [Acidothermaceae bacterium B102]